jgi:glycosyltransferase involved in cell wall biosynthesis
MDTTTLANSIFFDGSFLDNKAGTGRDSRNLLLAAKKAFGENVEVIYPSLTWNFKYRTSKVKPGRFLIYLGQLLTFLFGTPEIQIPPGSVFIQSHMGGPIPTGKEIKHIVRAHDIFPVTNPEWFRFASVRFFRNYFFKLSESCVIVCDSFFTKNEIKNERPELLDLRVAYCPVEVPKTLPCMSCQSCLSTSLLNEPYFIAIGTIEPRKNYELLVQIWSQSSVRTKYALNLIIFGKVGWKAKRITRSIAAGSSSGVLWMSNSCDYSLFEFLKNAQGFISISQAEGFNLPVAEAYLSGIPVILSRNSVHEEIFGKFANLIDPYDLPSFERKLLKLLSKSSRPDSFPDLPSYSSALDSLANQLY